MTKTMHITTGPRSQIYFEVENERQAQDIEWGGPEHDDKHDGSDWLSFIGKHMTRVGSQEADRSMPIFRKQMVRVAALAVAAIEWFDRRETGR